MVQNILYLGEHHYAGIADNGRIDVARVRWHVQRLKDAGVWKVNNDVLD